MKRSKIIFGILLVFLISSCGPSARERFEMEQSKNGVYIREYFNYEYPFSIKGIYSYELPLN